MPEDQPGRPAAARAMCFVRPTSARLRAGLIAEPSRRAPSKSWYQNEPVDLLALLRDLPPTSFYSGPSIFMLWTLCAARVTLIVQAAPGGTSRFAEKSRDGHALFRFMRVPLVLQNSIRSGAAAPASLQFV